MIKYGVNFSHFLLFLYWLQFIINSDQQNQQGKESNMGKIDDRLAELNLVLPAATEPKGTYVNIVRSGNLLFTGTSMPIAPSLPSSPSGTNATKSFLD